MSWNRLKPLVQWGAGFPAFLLLLVGSSPPLWGQQTARTLTEENIRSEPRGTILGRALPGTVFDVISEEEQWVEVQMEGWIWTQSIQTTDRLGFNLRVSASPQENLRAEPSGAILARLVEGTLLDGLDETEGWTRVQRAVWIWKESMQIQGSASRPTVDASEEPQAAAGGTQWWRTGEGPAPLLSVPDGDTLGSARPGAELQVLAREGNWVRVRLEGWAWAPEGEGGVGAEQAEPEAVTPEMVTSNPERFRGRTFSWELQFVSLERAEKIRTDFYEGEPFLLTRVPDTPGLFVYVAIPPERVTELSGLIPLERIRVVGRLRTGAAALTGNPILDLLEISRAPGTRD
jgi:hypothetical protein